MRFEVQSFKYDGSLHRSWTADLIHREGSLLVFDAVFDIDVEHDLLGRIARGTHSLEYYWLDRWYNIFRFSDAKGQLRNYYCNVNVPPTIEGNVLRYIDLDLDILVAPDFAYQILDTDDFERHAELYNYPADFRPRAQRAVDELVKMIEQRDFPFSG